MMNVFGIDDTTPKAMEEQRDLFYCQLSISYGLQADWVWSRQTIDGLNGVEYLNRKKFGPCVYFFVSGAHKGLIKIGTTSNAKDRVKSLKSECNTHDAGIIAAARTPHYKQFEFVLHEAHAFARKHGEWFELDAVKWYLQTIVRHKYPDLMQSEIKVAS